MQITLNQQKEKKKRIKKKNREKRRKIRILLTYCRSSAG